MHRWDAEDAAGGGWTPDPLAADGVDGFFEHQAVRPRGRPLGGTAHLHCADVDGEWLVEEPDLTVPSPCAASMPRATWPSAVRLPTCSLLLWRRRPLDGLEVFGDAGVAERLVARTDLE